MLHVFLFVLSGVLVCGVSLVTEMCRVNPETLTHFRRVCWELFSSPHFKLTYTDMHVTWCVHLLWFFFLHVYFTLLLYC